MIKKIKCYVFILFQGVEIHNNAKKGVIVQHYSLALRKVNRFQAGNYKCVASNVEGDGYSDTVELKIMCKYTSFSFVYHNQLLYKIYLYFYPPTIFPIYSICNEQFRKLPVIKRQTIIFESLKSKFIKN